MDEERFDTVNQEGWKYYSDKWVNELRTPSAVEILNYIWEKMGFPKNEKAIEYLVDFFENSILYFPPQLQKNALTVVQELSKKYKLAIISDTGFSPGKVMSQMLDEIDFKKYFSAFSYSDETGVAKPHPKAFDTVLEYFDCLPENALHIGDIERTDIEGAKNLGMYAIRYDGDPDSNLAYPKTAATKADFVATDWNEIIDFLDKSKL
jgi:putative hydrolase of the HAD superfamily